MSELQAAARNSAVRSPHSTTALDRVVIINDFSQQGGGATAIALNSAELLSERGIPVNLLAGDRGVNPSHLGRLVQCKPFGGQQLLSQPQAQAVFSGLYNASAVQFLADWIAENDTPGTIYHVHSWSQIFSASIFRALRPVADRLVVSAHDFFLTCPNGGYFNFRSEAPCELRPLSASCVLSRCDRRNYAHKLWRVMRQGIAQTICDPGSVAAAIVVVHEGMIPILQRGGIDPSKIVVLRNAVTPWRRERICAERNRNFLFVGRLEGDKGIDLLANASRRAGVPLLVIGDGNMKSMLVRQFPQVQLLGWKKPSEIGAYVADARLLVMPTRHRESFGLVAFEAMMSGLPALVSRHSLIAAEIEQSRFGLRCDPHDEVRLAAMMAMLSEKDALVEQMSRNAYAGARRFAPSPEQWVNGLIDLYTRLVPPERCTTGAQKRSQQTC